MYSCEVVVDSRSGFITDLQHSSLVPVTVKSRSQSGTNPPGQAASVLPKDMVLLLQEPKSTAQPMTGPTVCGNCKSPTSLL